MAAANHTPALDSSELEQFRLHAPEEIQHVLRDLARSTELVTAYFNDGREFILTAILQMDPAANQLVLDYGRDELLNRRLLEGGQAVLVTRHNQVRVQFTVDQLRLANYEGEPAFVAPLPRSLVRVQRREAYRLTIPLGRRLNISIVTPTGESLSAHIVDISVEGIGLIEPPAGWIPSCEPGTIVPGCRIELPEEGAIHADVEIRNRYESARGAGQQAYRIGCRLRRLDTHDSAAIQRYIHRVELERRRIRDD